MIEQAPRRLGSGAAGAGLRFKRHGGPVRLFVGFNDAQRLVAGIEDLDRSNDDALVGIVASRSDPGVMRCLEGKWRQSIEIKGETGERSDQIGAAVSQSRLECVGM